MERTGVVLSWTKQPSDTVEAAKMAESLGYESVWIGEGRGGDSFSILTACAVATERVGLGTAISNIYLRSAPLLAMATTCVDEFSNGRFVLGLGSSHRGEVQAEHGVPYGRPIQHIRERVEIVRKILDEGRVSFSGDTVNIDEFRMGIAHPGRRIPIFLAAVNPKMLRTCGEIADGVILTLSTVEHVRQAVEYIGEGARSVGRDPGSIEIALELGCAVSEKPGEARDRYRALLADYTGRYPRFHRLMAGFGYDDALDRVKEAWRTGNVDGATRLVPNELVDRVGVVGTADDVRARVQQYRDAGVTLPLLSPAVIAEDADNQALEALRACATG